MDIVFFVLESLQKLEFVGKEWDRADFLYVLLLGVLGRYRENRMGVEIDSVYTIGIGCLLIPALHENTGYPGHWDSQQYCQFWHYDVQLVARVHLEILFSIQLVVQMFHFCAFKAEFVYSKVVHLAYLEVA